MRQNAKPQFLNQQESFASLQAQKGGNCDLWLRTAEVRGIFVDAGWEQAPTNMQQAIAKLILCSGLIWVTRSSSCQSARVQGRLIVLVISLEQKKNSRCASSLQYPHTLSPKWKLNDKNHAFPRCISFHKVLSTFSSPYFNKGKPTILLTLDLFIFYVSLSTCSLLTIQHAASPDKSG